MKVLQRSASSAKFARARAHRSRIGRPRGPRRVRMEAHASRGLHDRTFMKIATFNVNGIGSRLSHLIEWLKRESPDVACLQELKATDRNFPALALRQVGYESIWQ